MIVTYTGKSRIIMIVRDRLPHLAGGATDADEMEVHDDD